MWQDAVLFALTVRPSGYIVSYATLQLQLRVSDRQDPFRCMDIDTARWSTMCIGLTHYPQLRDICISTLRSTLHARFFDCRRIYEPSRRWTGRAPTFEIRNSCPCCILRSAAGRGPAASLETTAAVCFEHRPCFPCAYPWMKERLLLYPPFYLTHCTTSALFRPRFSQPHEA